MNRLAIIIAGILGISFSGYGEDYSHIKFRYYKAEQGLSSNTVQCILQDRKGFMWFGTSEGLNRFDSQNFKIYRHQAEDTSSLCNDGITCLLEDTEGHIWIGTENGVSIYFPETDHFRFFPLPGTSEHNTFISAFTQDRAGNIWIGTGGQGLFRFSLQDRKTYRYTFDSRDSTTLSSNIIRALLTDNAGNVWIGTAQDGINLYTSGQEGFKRINMLPDQSTSQSAHALLEDSYGYIWIGTWDQGIYRYDRSQGTFTNCLNKNGKGTIQHIHSITEYQPGILLIGSDSGLTLYYVTENRSHTFRYDPEIPYSLNDYFVYSIYTDREKGIWVGTYFGGINYLSPNTTYFHLYTYTTGKNSLCGKIVSKFFEAPDGKIYIGTDDNGLCLFDPIQKKFQQVSIDPAHPALNVHAIYADRRYLWVGTYSRGLYRKDLHSGRVEHYIDNPVRLNSNSVYALYRDRTGKLWLGAKNGIFLYHKNKDYFECIRDLGYNGDVTDITEDTQGNLWFATTSKGLWGYNPKTDHLTCYSECGSSLPLLIGCLCVHEDRLWIGTYGKGLYYRDLKTGEFFQEPSPVFQHHNSLFTLLPDRNNLWITTNQGLLKYDIRTRKANSFNHEDGLQGNLFNPNSGLKSSTGCFYFGGSNGFNCFTPENIRENLSPVPVVFTNFQLLNKEVPIAPESVLSRHIDWQRQLTLKKKHSVFSIEFIALSFCAPSRNEYRYILEGFNESWVPLKAPTPKITYTNLSPGKYTFKVRACNNDGIWNPTESVIHFTILPPWWITRTAILIYLLAGISTLVWIYFLLLKRTNRIHRKRMALLQETSEKQLLNSKIDFFTHITHEIRTPLSLITGPLEEILKKKNIPEELQDDLEVMRKNSNRLLDLVNQALDYRKAEQNLTESQKSVTDINDLIQQTVERFIPAARKNNIDLSYNGSPVPLPAYLNKEAVIKILSNLLSNALKFARNKIEVSLTGTESELTLCVKDNGKGISPEEQQKIFSIFYQTEQPLQASGQGFGIGLAIVSLLLKKLKAEIQIDSKEGEYTLFSVRIPREKNNKQECEEEELYTPSVRTAETSQGSILIVEDNEDFSAYLQKVISSCYRVRTVSNGKEALQYLEQQETDLVISDVMMPGLDGWELCKQIKENIHLSHIPVILLTARVDTDSKIKGLENGADVYIEKPVSLSYLQAQIASLLENRNKLRRLFSQVPFTPLNSITKNKTDEEFLEKMNQVIENNIANSEFTVDDIARSVNMSRSILYAKVKAISGLTPNEFIRLIRLRKAAEYLTSTEYKINEICYLVGFNGASYFAKCFQAQFGMLPKDFAAKHKNSC